MIFGNILLFFDILFLFFEVFCVKCLLFEFFLVILRAIVYIVQLYPVVLC